MKKLELTLYQFSIDELEEYRSLLKEGNRILGLEVNSYEERIEYLVGFAITQALKAEREHLADLKREVEENKMDRNLQSMKDAVYELDDIRGGMSLHKILLDDIHTEVAWLSEKIDEKSWEQATTYWNEVQMKLRILTALLSYAKGGFQKEFTDLEEVHESFLKGIVLNGSTKKAHSVAPE